MMYTYHSAFAGIGGMTMGLKPLGFKGLVAWEYEPSRKRQITQEAHRLLHPEIEVRGDIREETAADLPHTDLFCFTPPCQTFSTAGKREGANFICSECEEIHSPDIDEVMQGVGTCATCGNLTLPRDDRGVLTYDALKIVQATKPKMLFMENVRGLIMHNKGLTLQTILQAIQALGYYSDFALLDSQQFGVAQRRVRFYLVAIRKDLHKTEKWKPVENKRLNQLKEQYQTMGIEGFNFNWHIPNKQVLLGEVLEHMPSPLPSERELYLMDLLPLEYTEEVRIPVKGFGRVVEFVSRETKVVGRHLDCNNKYCGSQGFAYVRLNGVAHTLTTGDIPRIIIETKENGQVTGHTIRKMTSREILRLQGIEGEYAEKLLTHYSPTQIQRFAGNGLTIPVIKAIGTEIKAMLDKIKS